MPHLLTRESNTCLKICGESFGCQHLKILGTRLPTYKQVLFCYLANRCLVREQDESKRENVEFQACNNVIKEVILHYEKAGIQHKDKKCLKRDILKYYKMYDKARKSKPNQLFLEMLPKTIPLWQKNCLKFMKKQLESGLPSHSHKKRLSEDIRFLESMMTNTTDY